MKIINCVPRKLRKKTVRLYTVSGWNFLAIVMSLRLDAVAFFS